jgi:hypothetical protein
MVAYTADPEAQSDLKEAHDSVLTSAQPSCGSVNEASSILVT